MKDDIKIIADYISELGRISGYDIIIDDPYGLLSASATLSMIPEIGKWHNNPYCMKIKENPKLWGKCIYFKKNYISESVEKNDFYCHTCFCGVSEYNVPIVIGGIYIGAVIATGFRGKLNNNMEAILARRCNMDVQSFRELRLSALRSAADCEQSLHALLNAAAKMIYDYLSSTGEAASILQQSRSNSTKYILQALDYIERHYTSEIRVSDVAASCHISESYLKHLFTKFHGRSVNEEIVHRRMEKAAQMLCTGAAYSVKEIAFAVGAMNSDYFSVVFRRYYGSAPTEYRKLHRNAAKKQQNLKFF